MSTDYRIRRARLEELPALPALEQRAGQRFRKIPGLAGLADDLTPLDELLQAEERGDVWVVTVREEQSEVIAGFAYGAPLKESFHLEEISVLPEYGRRGFGKALVLAVVQNARARGFSAVTLSTFQYVPWNAPFYARLGFQIVPLEALEGDLKKAFTEEEGRGLPIEIRAVMRLDLD